MCRKNYLVQKLNMYMDARMGARFVLHVYMHALRVRVYVCVQYMRNKKTKLGGVLSQLLEFAKQNIMNEIMLALLAAQSLYLEEE